MLLDFSFPFFSSLFSREKSETVALAACEFWSALCELRDVHEVTAVLVPHLPRLIPLLLSSMAYSDEELASMGDAGDYDALVPDRHEDISPIFRKNAGSMSSPPGGDDDAGEGAAGEPSAPWNLRKSAASGLDTVSATLRPGVLLPILLPHLNRRLQDRENWVVRESAILALGAIAEGCAAPLEEHLPQLFPFLASMLDDPQPLVRSITCWTLGRYGLWVCEQHRVSPGRGYFQTMLSKLLERCLDNHKKVQEAACSALSVLVEFAETVSLIA